MSSATTPLFEAFLVKKETVDEETVDGAATDLGLKRSSPSGAKPLVSPKNHPVIPPEGLDTEEMESLGLIEDTGTD